MEASDAAEAKAGDGDAAAKPAEKHTARVLAAARDGSGALLIEAGATADAPYSMGVRLQSGKVVPFGFVCPDARWTHLAFVCSRYRLKLFADGELVATLTAAQLQDDGEDGAEARDTATKKPYGGYGEYKKKQAPKPKKKAAPTVRIPLPDGWIGDRRSAMHGDLCEARAWAVARTPSEIRRDMGVSLPLADAGGDAPTELLGRWRLVAEWNDTGGPSVVVDDAGAWLPSPVGGFACWVACDDLPVVDAPPEESGQRHSAAPGALEDGNDDEDDSEDAGVHEGMVLTRDADPRLSLASGEEAAFVGVLQRPKSAALGGSWVRAHARYLTCMCASQR